MHNFLLNPIFGLAGQLLKCQNAEIYALSDLRHTDTHTHTNSTFISIDSDAW